MNTLECMTRRLTWFLALLFATFMAGCGGGGGGGGGQDPILGGNGAPGAAPTVAAVSPLANATAVAVTGRTISAAFSGAMDPATLTTTSFTLACPAGTALAGTVAYAAGGNTATLTLASDLPANANCTATITTAARNAAGIALASSFTWSFTTGASSGTPGVAPAVTVVAPLPNAVAVPVNGKIVSATFTKAMDPATLTAASFTLACPAGTALTGSVGTAGNVATLTLAANLPASTICTATITMAAKDTTGLALASDFSWTFSTGATTDTTAPTVTGTIHANGQTNVAVNTKVGATFSEAMDPATVTALTFLVKETVGSAAVAGTVAYSGVGAVFSPQTSLKPSTGYTVTVKGGAGGAKDLAGNPLATDFVIAWTTGLAPDTTAPRVIATINANGATGVPINTRIGATFSEGMDAATITATTFTFKQGTSNVASAISYSGVDVVLTPVSPLASSTVYTATISTGVKDLAGNAVAADYVWSWTTAASADATSPTITLANPANLATNVAVNSAVNATFSKAMDPLTISTANFAVQTAGPPLGPILAGLTAYDAVSRIATFTPSSPLAAGTTYSVTFTGAKDLTGNALIPGVVPNPSTFATAADSVLAPGAVALGSAGTYGIMATSAVTNTGLSTINGDVSLDPGTSMTGFPPGVVNGAIHINDSVSAQARADLLVAYNFAKTLAPGTTISGGADLGALYPTGIPPGTYTSGSTMLVSTPLTLDAGGNANAVWVFQIGSSLTTGASVSLANGAQAKNVFWVPTSDATIGVGTIFYGTIVSGRDVTAVTGATINGRILAGAITAGTIALQTSTVNVPAP